MITVGRAACIALLLAVLAGCATDQAADPDPPTNRERPYEGLAFDLSEVPPELRVPRPKDVRGIPPCKLLTDAQLSEVGLLTDTATEDIQPGRFGRGCTWQLADNPLNVASIGLGTDAQNPVLPGLYVEREVFARFEPIQIVGHPGVSRSLNPDSGCEIDVAPPTTRS